MPQFLMEGIGVTLPPWPARPNGSTPSLSPGAPNGRPLARRSRWSGVVGPSSSEHDGENRQHDRRQRDRREVDAPMLRSNQAAGGGAVRPGRVTVAYAAKVLAQTTLPVLVAR